MAGGLEVTPLSDALGAAIGGLDLGTPPDAATASRLDALLARHLLLLFRGQSLTPQRMLQALKGGEYDGVIDERLNPDGPATDGLETPTPMPEMQLTAADASASPVEICSGRSPMIALPS